MGTVEHRVIGDREVRLTNLDKVLFPDDGITKRELVDYVLRVSDPLLAALRDRPLSMERRPDGLGGPGFFHKHRPDHFPDWVASVTSETSKGPMVQALVQDRPTLALVTNFGCLTPHVPTSTVDHPLHPDQLVVDLDPSIDDLGALRAAGHAVREVLTERGLPAFARWSGSRGIHVVVPLDRTADHREVAAAADALAAELVARWPERFTTAFKKADRGERFYLDMARNHPGSTVVASWAVRARAGAPVAMPVTWEEIDHTGPRSFTLRTAPDRLELDPWPGYESQRVDLRAGFTRKETVGRP